ncbi:MAG: ABC transporter permease [Roseivirga sp.]
MQDNSKSANPPFLLNRFLLWFCDDDLSEEIAGDLHQEYQHNYLSYGRAKANRNYFISVFQFVKPRFMQKLSNTQDYVPRFGNYLKVSLRNFQKHKLVSAINLFGFAIGLTVMMTVGMYLHYQWSADRFVPGADNVYRVVKGYRSQIYASLGFKDYYQTSRNEQKAMMNALGEVPEVEVAAQFTTSSSAIMNREFFATANDRRMPEREVLFTNTPEAFQKLFNWPVLAGSVNGALYGKVVLTRSTARRFFGDDWRTATIGKPLVLGDTGYLIAAVVEDVPESSHLGFNMVAMVDSIPYTWGAYTYIKLSEGGNLADLEQKITEANRRINADNYDENLEKGLFLQPLTSIHLGSDHLYELEANVNPTYIYLFALIGLIILVITCTNYVNLTIAIYANRFKEVGVRKVIGARTKDVRVQFLFESVFTTLLALPLAFGLVYVLLPQFNQLMGIKLTMAELLSPIALAMVLGFTVLTGLLCGVYPAGMLSRMPLLSLIKNSVSVSGRFGLRKMLMGFQFLLLMILSGFAFYVNRQLTYISEKDLGFDKEGILAFDFGGADRFALLKQELLKNPAILQVGNGGLPGNEPFNTVTYQFEGVDEIFDDANQLYMDLGSVKTLGLWTEAFEALENGKERVLVINEAAARKYEQVSGKPRENLVGGMITESPTDRQEDGNMGYPQAVDGFIRDFNYFSLREQHTPLFLYVFKDMPWVYNVQVKVNEEALVETLGFIEETYYKFEPESPFNAVLLTDRLKKLYGDDDRIADLVLALSYLSVLLAFGGLVGLTYYMARIKQREVAIRKVLGARVAGLLVIMSREFLVIAFWSSLLAIPITLFAVNYWLDHFAFHVRPNVLTLVALGVLGMFIMVFGVVSQSYKTARANPVDKLKQE